LKIRGFPLNTELKRVMVVGGGIAGLTAAWELSKLGIEVDLVEKTAFLGGHAIQFCCKATDECQQCGACSVEKMLKNVVDEPTIKIHFKTEIETVNSNDRFTVTLNKGPEYIDPAKCTNCGICFEKCPSEGALIRGYSKNNIPLYAICEDNCLFIKNKSCTVCQDACPEAAIEMNKTGSLEELDVDAIILATGFQPFDSTEKPTYGYGKFNNVMTGLDLERSIRENGSGVRPSDGKEPQRVAFIQCVGSRDEHLGNLWCSQVCCPYALRMSETIKHKNPDTDITIFYMDIQNTDNNFEDFYKKCKSDLRFIRNIPVDICPMEDGRLRLRYMGEDDGLPVDEEFDLVVLSIGITPGIDNRKLSELFGINLNEDGFFLSIDTLNRSTTSKEGIFVAGTAEGPKTIAASMAHAGQAACEAMKYLKVTG
jgi:heterodisulfide reductase subunit A